MIMERALRSAVAARTLRDLDLHFAIHTARLAHAEGDAVLLAAALVSARTGEGDVCVALAEAAAPLFVGESFRGIATPPFEEWRRALRASGVVGAPGDWAPLILDGGDRLYLARYFRFERTIGEQLTTRGRIALATVDVPRVRRALDHHFPSSGPASTATGKVQMDLWAAASPEPETDHQRLAAVTALLRPLAIIAGGPGTGKTTTVTRLLALVLEQQWPHVPRIALAAPTGKAAARLSESIKAQKTRLAAAPEIVAAIPDEASTIHRLLGVMPGRTGFRHHIGNPLHVDLLVVDEVSMVDVPTMARLLEALPPAARLVLLGDPDQLASVEAGSVLGDICNRGAAVGCSAAFRAAARELGTAVPEQPASASPLADSRVILERSRRFGAESGIGHLARRVNEGDGERALEVLRGGHADLGWRELDAATLQSALAETALAACTDHLAADTPAEALERLNRFRILCALREGPFGVAEVNRFVEQALRRTGRISGGERHYAGRPIMITRNDYTLGLFNGDVGVVWPDDEGRLRAFFTRPDGSVRRVLLTRLPDHETVFAMTIHKSQGSEFDRCVVLLPGNDAPLLTRELLYTGITRARTAVELWSTRPILLATIGRRIVRQSGLRAALWGTADAEAIGSVPSTGRKRP